MPTENRSAHLCASRDLFERLQLIASGKLGHINAGICPDHVAGHEKRDEDCPACIALIELDSLLAPPAEHQVKPVAYRWEQLGGKGYMYGDELPAGVFTPWQEPYVAADAGEVERLRAEVKRLDLSVAESDYGYDLRCANFERELAERDALLDRVVDHANFWHDHPYAEVVEAIARDYKALSASAEPAPEGRQLHKKPGVLPRAHDASMFQRSAEPSARAAQYPNRLCHIDYTAHPYLCGCLRGDEESQRIYDEHCRAANAEPEVKR